MAARAASRSARSNLANVGGTTTSAQTYEPVCDRAPGIETNVSSDTAHAHARPACDRARGIETNAPGPAAIAIVKVAPNMSTDAARARPACDRARGIETNAPEPAAAATRLRGETTCATSGTAAAASAATEANRGAAWTGPPARPPVHLRRPLRPLRPRGHAYSLFRRGSARQRQRRWIRSSSPGHHRCLLAAGWRSRRTRRDSGQLPPLTAFGWTSRWGRLGSGRRSLRPSCWISR